MSIIPNLFQKSSSSVFSSFHNASTPTDVIQKSPIASPALTKDLICNWNILTQENQNYDEGSFAIPSRSRARSFQTKKQSILTKSNTLQSHNHLTRPTKRFAGSIIIENQMSEQFEPGLMKKQSNGSFSSDLYNKIEEFLDMEGLDIIQTESFMDGFKQIIKIQIEESPEKEGDDLSEDREQLTVVRFMSSPLMISDDLSSSTLQRRRALKVKRAQSENGTPDLNCQFLIPACQADEYEDHKEIKSALLPNSATRKKQFESLSCVESCDEQSEVPGNETPVWKIDSLTQRNSLIQGFEKLLPQNGIRATVSFLEEKEETPGGRKDVFFSPQSKWRRLANGNKKNSSCRDLFKGR